MRKDKHAKTKSTLTRSDKTPNGKEVVGGNLNDMRDFETPEAAADLSQALEDQGQIGAARRVLASAVARWPEHPGLWHNLGIAHQEDGDWEAAIASFTTAIGLGYPSRLNRGCSYEQVGATESARRDYLEVLRVSPDDVSALVDLGTLELQLGRTQTAKDLLTRAAALDPTVNWQLADVFEALGERDQAKEALSAAIAAGESRAYLDRADLESDTDPSAATADYLAAIAAEVRWARRAYSIFLDIHDDPDAARQVALDGIRSGDESCFAPLAVIEEAAGNLDEAAEYYQRAIDFGDTAYQSDLDALRDRGRSN